MSYFEEVYLKRINSAGTTRQDRIKTAKEREFDRIFLKQTQYRAQLYQINDLEVNYTISLQPNNWNESNLISNLLMSTSAAALKTGDLLFIRQKIKNKEVDKIWLVIFVEENLTKGYQLFKVICLDTNINITDEYGTTKIATPAKFVNATSSFMQDTYTRSKAEMGYREPFTTRIVVIQDSDEIRKGTYFEYMDRNWEIASKDNISIPNVAYLFITERLKKENEPLSSKDIEVGKDVNFFLNGR